MSDTDWSRWDGLDFAFDFDAASWLPVRQGGQVLLDDDGIGRAVRAWTQDCGYPADGDWAAVLATMLGMVARGAYEQEPYVVLAHIRDIAGAAPFVTPVIMTLVPDEDDADTFAGLLVEQQADVAARPAVHDRQTLRDGTGVSVLRLLGRAADTR